MLSGVGDFRKTYHKFPILFDFEREFLILK